MAWATESNQVAAKPSVALTKRAKLLCVAGALVLLTSAAVLPVMFESGPYGNAPLFRVDRLGQTTQGGTNILVFRLTSLDHARNYLLPFPGYISTPLAATQFSAATFVASAFPDPFPGRWTGRAEPEATSVTNFALTRFRTAVDFAIFAPTDKVWRLDVRVLYDLSGAEMFRWKTRKAWEYLKARNFSAIPGAWSGPSSASLNFATWSSPITNAEVQTSK